MKPSPTLNRLHRVPPASTGPRAGQRGAALFIGLIMLLMITAIALIAASSQTTELRMASNTQKHNIAFQTAEATLRYAEVGLEQGIYTNFTANSGGLYTCTPVCQASGQPWYVSPATTLAYAGPALSSDASAAGTPPTPTFVIEQLPSIAPPGSAIDTSGGYGGNGTPPVVVFRITAYGTGADLTSRVQLQSIFY